jgi:hypothetical protein
MSAGLESKGPDRSRLEEFDEEDDGRLPFYLTYTEVKLLGIAGVSSVIQSGKMILFNDNILVPGWILP